MTNLSDYYWKTNEYIAGYEAFEAGLLSDANPYPVNTEQHDNWQAGWDEALEDS